MSETNQTQGGVDDPNDAASDSWAPGMLLCFAAGWLLVTVGTW